MSIENSMNNFRKVSLSFRPELYDRIAEYSEKMCISRSAFVSLCVSNYIDAQELMPSINGLMGSLSSLVDQYAAGNITPDGAQMKLDELEAEYQRLRK